MRTGTEAIADGLIRGDVELRRRSAVQLAGRGSLPALLLARRMRGRFGVSVRRTQQDEFLFGLIRADRKERTADLSVEFEFQPWPSPPPRSDASTILYEPPAYLENPGVSRDLRLRLKSGGGLLVDFDETGRLVSVCFSDQEREPSNRWTGTRAAAWLDTQADQIRREATSAAQPIVLRETLTTSFDHIIGELQKGYSLLRETIGEKQARCADMRGALEPTLPERYRLSGAQAKVKAWVAADGHLVTDPAAPAARQIDLRARIVEQGGRAELRLQTLPAGFLVDGDVRRRILVAIREAGSRRRRATLFDQAIEGGVFVDPPRRHPERLRRRGTRMHRAFQEFLASCVDDPDSLVARVDRSDDDLVLLRGTFAERRAWLLYRMQVEARPGRKAKIKSGVTLVSGHLEKPSTAKRDQLKLRRRAEPYFQKGFEVLRDWQLRIGAR